MGTNGNYRVPICFSGSECVFVFPFLQIGSLCLPMYGLFIVLGTAAGVGIAMLRARRTDIPVQDICFCAVYAGVGVFVGAKLLYLLTILPQLYNALPTLLRHPETISALLGHGFVFYGGLIGAVIGVRAYTRRYRLKFWAMTDHLIVSVPLIHAFGRLGCFCAGCCWGRPMAPPLGLYFTASPVAPHDMALFPVQLLEASLNLVLFFMLLAYASKPRKPAVVTTAYVCAYGIQRFVLEFFRADAARGVFLGLSTSQWISLLLIPAAFFALYILQRRTSTPAA